MFNHIHPDALLHSMQKIGLLIFLFVFVLAVVRACLTPKARRNQLKAIPLQDDLKETPRAAGTSRHEN